MKKNKKVGQSVVFCDKKTKVLLEKNKLKKFSQKITKKDALAFFKINIIYFKRFKQLEHYIYKYAII